MLNLEKARSLDILAPALQRDLTERFFHTLWYKVKQKPPENINIEIKGQPRSGKSSGAIFLYIWLSEAWGYEPTVENILPNQSELLFRLKDAKFGETFVVDETRPESYGEGVLTEQEQLGTNIDICAKKCNNLIFIFPPRFLGRSSAYGLETLGKDNVNKWNKFFLYDIGERRALGFSMFPIGYVTIPKYIDDKYVNLPMKKWSEKRLKNFKEKAYDYDSQFEEDYEEKKDLGIESVRRMDGSFRNKMKEELAEKLLEDEGFVKLKKRSLRIAYLQIKMNRGELMDMSKSEMVSLVDMAEVLQNEGE